MGEIPEAMVERAAVALARANCIEWDATPPAAQGGYRVEAEAALEAAGVGELLETAKAGIARCRWLSHDPETGCHRALGETCECAVAFNIIAKAEGRADA